VALLLASSLAAAGAGGCQSTQSKSKELAKKGNKALHQRGLTVGKQNSSVHVVATSVVQDQNGAAVVVTLRNAAPKDVSGLPISIRVLGNRGATLFENNAPGLASSLVQAPVLPARGEADWVNDQVPVTGAAKSAKAVVGDSTAQTPAKLPHMTASTPSIAVDPVSGVEANGTVKNDSSVEQRALIVYAVARKGGRVVAAGRGEIPRLKPGKSGTYHIFFIGNPRGGRVSVTAPPTVLQ
jgi:hypothetical protein